MFKFLKNKIKSAVNSFSKKAEKEVEEEKIVDEEVIEEAKSEEKELLKVDDEVVEEVLPTIEEERARAEEEERKKELEQEKSKKIDEEVLEKTEEKEVKNKEEDLEDYKEYDKTDEEIKEVFEESHSINIKEKTESLEEENNISKEELVVNNKTLVKEEKVEEETFKEGKKESPQEEIKENIPAKEDLETIEKNNDEVKETIKEEKEEPQDLEETESEDVIEKETHKVIEDEEQKEIEEEQEPPKKKGFFGKLKESFTKKTLSEEKFDDLFWDLEVSLLENNVAVEVIEKIKEDLKITLTSGKVSRLGIEELITLSLKKSITELFDVPTFDLLQKIKSKKDKPFKIAFIGVNGSGKTTTLAKIANLFLNNDLRVVMAASDTFRAAAIDQLQEHASNLGIKMISQGYNADPAAVAFDAIEHAKSKNLDVVMIDTAGRLHSNTNLMVELEKVIRVSKPDLKIFIGESITGNDCVEQAKQFDEKVGIDAIILSKADVDEKGGAAISVSYVTGKPILYLGVGQNYGDLKKFDKHKIIESMGL